MRILSYNVQFLPLPFMHIKKRKQRIGKFISKSKFEIVCLQENFIKKYTFLPGQTIHVMESFLPEYNCAYSPLPSEGLFRMCNSGLSTYSLYPMLRSRFFTFTKSTYTDRFAAKGILYTKLQIETNKQIHVFNVHLQSGLSKKCNNIRSSQLREMKQFISEIVQEDNHPIVIAGDFNQTMYTTDFVPFFREQCSTASTGLTYKNRVLDYIFTQQRIGEISILKSSNHTLTSSKRKMNSDHCGISVTININ